MVRQGFGVPKVDPRQEIAFLAGGQLLEHLFDVDVRHLAGLEVKVGWVENNYDVLNTAELLRWAYLNEGTRFKESHSLTSVVGTA